MAVTCDYYTKKLLRVASAWSAKVKALQLNQTNQLKLEPKFIQFDNEKIACTCFNKVHFLYFAINDFNMGLTHEMECVLRVREVAKSKLSN